MKTRVIFRRWKSGKKKDTIFALFPELKGPSGKGCVCSDMSPIAHVVDYKTAIRKSIAVVDSPDLETLKSRLKKAGLDLDIRSNAAGAGRPKIDLDRKRKYCPVCEKKRSTDKFGSNKASYDGLHSTCLSCAKIECGINQIRGKSRKELDHMKRALENKALRIERIMESDCTTRELAKMEVGTLPSS